MKLNFSAWAIHNPIPSILLFILLAFVGGLSFITMKVQNFPDFDLPIVTIAAALPGAGPEQLENDVARKIEDSLASIQHLKHIETTLTDGNVSITVTFQLDKPLQEALDDVKDAVSRVRSDLPSELRDPVIQKLMLSNSAILAYTVSAEDQDEEAISWLIDNQIAKRLLAVDGVGNVSRVGGVSREIRVELSSITLQALNISAADISKQVRQVQLESSGGKVEIGDMERSVRVMATVQSARELGELNITLPDGRNFRLGQIAKVYDTVAETRSTAMLDGHRVVGFEVVRARGASELEVMDKVRLALDEFSSQHPEIHITEAFNFVNPVRDNYDGSIRLLYDGAALAILVVFLFLRDWRATVISAIALPLSVIPSFAVMHWLGFTLNTVSLLSLSLVVGILVDDAIVEIENIVRDLRMGKPPKVAAIEAADEIGLAVIATTFTLIAIFLPTAFMGGIPGKFFVEFGWTAAIAVFFSLVVARLLTPMMAAYLLKLPKDNAEEPKWLQRYSELIEWSLQHRFYVLLAAAAFLIGSLILASRLPASFIPPDDVPQTQVTITLPPGSSLLQTEALAEQARQLVISHQHVMSVYTTIGAGTVGADPFDTASASDVNSAVLTLTLSPRQQRPGITRPDIEMQLRGLLTQLAGARIKTGMGDAENYQVVLSGEDHAQLMRHAQLVERELRSIAGVGAVTSSASLVRPELILRPNFPLAAELGVTSAVLAETIRIATSGDYIQNLSKLNLNERQLPIVVKLSDISREQIETVKRLPLPSHNGAVPLENVVAVEFNSRPADITRYDRRRNITFDIELNGQPLGRVEQAALNLPSLRNLPAGISLSPAGDAEAMAELFSSFGLAMVTGVLCVYLLLVLLFKAFLQPVTILAALVLSIPGAVFALAITNSTLSMPSMIGIIMLMGIATKNSILLVDYILLARREHQLNRWHAVIDACRKRARPIVMTTLAMGAGMLPVALGWGADPSFRVPMGTVVIGGLITSTILSLLVIPILFTYIDDLRIIIIRQFRTSH